MFCDNIFYMFNISVISFRLIPKKLMSSYTGMGWIGWNYLDLL